MAVQWCVLMPALRENLPLYAGTLFRRGLVLRGLTRYLSRRGREPVEELAARAKAGEPCPEDGPIRELNTLATAVNAGRGRLEEQLSRERAFTRAAAHELKTPLAVLRTHAEALREDIAPARRGEYLDVVLDEAKIGVASMLGSRVRVKNWSWFADDKQEIRQGGFAGWLTDGTPLWVTGSGTSNKVLTR